MRVSFNVIAGPQTGRSFTFDQHDTFMIGRSEDAPTFRAMLNLKIIWSAAATLGIVWSQLEGGPPLGWALAGIFAAFNVLWIRYRLLLGSEVGAEGAT